MLWGVLDTVSVSCPLVKIFASEVIPDGPSLMNESFATSLIQFRGQTTLLEKCFLITHLWEPKIKQCFSRRLFLCRHVLQKWFFTGKKNKEKNIDETFFANVILARWSLDAWIPTLYLFLWLIFNFWFNGHKLRFSQDY